MWWQDRKDVLMTLCRDPFPLIVYDEETLNDLFFDLLSIGSIDRCFYAVRTNPHPGIIKKAFEIGLDFLIGNMEEEELVRASCPGIKSDRIFFTPEALSFPNISVRNNPGISRRSLESDLTDLFVPPRETGDIQDYPKEIERIREKYPNSELWFTCGPREISPAGALLTQVTGEMKGRNGFLVPLGEDFSDRIKIENNSIEMEIFNLSGYDRDPTPLPYNMETNQQAGGFKCRIEASACIKKGDIILIPTMGAYPNIERGGTTALTGSRQGREYFLRARKMCQIKL